MNTTSTTGQIPKSKAELLTNLTRFFPTAIAETIRAPHIEHGDFSDVMRRSRQHFESCMLPYWLSLAPAYAETLAQPGSGDSARLKTHVQPWPSSFQAQQAQLHHLLSTSKLRSPWHQYCHLLSERSTSQNKAEHLRLDAAMTALDQALDEWNIPIKEIPLYQGYMRVSCQQLICLPLSEWDKLASGGDYNPSNAHPQTVEQLATRVAQVFNAPPVVALDLLKDTPGWPEATVWKGGQRMLTCATSQHGIRDRFRDEYSRPHEGVENPPQPDWRYLGFCGEIGVTLENGTPWVVCVLAPQHFVHHMMCYEQGFPS